MIRSTILLLTLGAALAGCFFSLDGSLVNRKPDAQGRDARSEVAQGTDAPSDRLPTEGLVDLPGATDLASTAEKPATE